MKVNVLIVVFACSLLMTCEEAKDSESVTPIGAWLLVESASVSGDDVVDTDINQDGINNDTYFVISDSTLTDYYLYHGNELQARTYIFSCTITANEITYYDEHETYTRTYAIDEDQMTLTYYSQWKGMNWNDTYQKYTGVIPPSGWE